MSGNSEIDTIALPRSRRPLPPDPEDLASMHGRVVEWLGSRIATGHLTGVLDLDKIVQEFQVSRSLVRECLRTLAAKGMVQARQRTGTSVTDPEHWALLDEQLIRWRAAGPKRFVQMQESLELRLCLEPFAARSLAERRDPESLARLQDAAHRIGEAIEADSGPLMIQADTAFHRELYLGSGNSMLARLAGTVHGCLRIPDFQLYRTFSSDTAYRHQHLADAISAGAIDQAEEETRVLTELTVTIFHNAYQLALEDYRTAAQSTTRVSVPGARVQPGADQIR